MALTWALTSVGVVALVLVLEAWVVRPYRVSGASMEPTLHCAGAPSCLGGSDDGVLVNRLIYRFRSPLREPYVPIDRRDHAPLPAWHAPAGRYFVMGDNRADSCDSRAFGSIARADIVGKVFFVYWPPKRIGFR